MFRFKQIKSIISILLFLLFCVAASAEDKKPQFVNMVFTW